MPKYVYLFTEGNAQMRNLLGGKGANLAEMTNIGLPVPQGFIVTTEACIKYYEDGQTIAPEVEQQILDALKKAEGIVGKKFGDLNNPFLVSVRSGARASMPGMMDTILNLGLNDSAVEGLARLTQNERFAYDSYRRFIQMFADVVMEIERRLGFEPVDRETEKLGYDIESRDPRTGKLRFLEVKGRISGAATITVTRNEILYSLNKPEDFILAIVEFMADNAHRIHYVRRPFQREPDFGVTSVNYDFGELLARAEAPR